MSTTAGRIQDLRNRLDEAQAPLGQDAIDAVHEAGDLTCLLYASDAADDWCIG